MDETSETMSGAPAPVSMELQFAVERFLYLEAELLDDRRFDDWLTLTADDVDYFIPFRQNRLPGDEAQSVRPATEGGHMMENRADLFNRVHKLSMAHNWSEYPQMRHRHIVTNIRVRERAPGHEYDVRSNIHLYRSRMNDVGDNLYGERRDVLRRAPNGYGFVLARRTVYLDHALMHTLALTTFI